MLFSDQFHWCLTNKVSKDSNKRLLGFVAASLALTVSLPTAPESVKRYLRKKTNEEKLLIVNLAQKLVQGNGHLIWRKIKASQFLLIGYM